LVLHRSKAKVFLFSFAIVVSLQHQVMAEKTISSAQLFDKMRGMWLGQLIGNAAGRATEGKYSGAAPNPESEVPWEIKQQWDADDDTDIEYIAIHILETDGLGCSNEQIAEQWLTHIDSPGIYIANKQAWYLMGDGYLPPETGGRTYNEHWYSIDSQICTEVLGAISPGLVQASIDLTGKFAHITNTGFPVHAAQFYAAMYANAFFEQDVIELVTEALAAIPTTSRTHEVVSDVLAWYLEDENDGDLNWRSTRLKLYNKYQGSDSYGRYYQWIESTVNTGATVLAILYGQGDFKETVQIGVLAGWDCDCNPATAGGLLGIILGFNNLPADLTDPSICGDVYENVYRPYLPNPDQSLPQYDTITNIVSRLTTLAAQNIIANGGHATSSDSTTTYHIPNPCAIIPEPEKPDPEGPAGLVGEALLAGITVTPSAAVQRYNSEDDRENLYAIINGVSDNSYNGHKPYWSRYSYVPPNKDWYQLNFSQPVKFEQITFYEGDIVWNHINTYYRDENARGGFFEDLTVEILRDGEFIEPANLQMTPVLDHFKMYQAITFDFSPTVGQAIRIIGSPGGTERFTTILELEAQGDTDPGLYVESVKIADGQIQRSNVNRIEIQFSHDITVTKDNIEVTGTTHGTVVDMDEVGFYYNASTKQLTLSFPQRLQNDTYSLALDCASITDADGLALLDDDKNPGDGFYTIRFHNLFGDADGSGAVDFSDFSILASRWLNSPADTGLDSNADGILDILDMRAFAENWLHDL